MPTDPVVSSPPPQPSSSSAPANAAPSIPPSEATRFGELRGTSLAMRHLFAVLERVAQTEAAVLILGETGTGKELAAEAIHAAGSRRGGPFVVCDLAGVARSLIESELFGHVRGAFTGADRERDGAFAQAGGGTIFIDEVAELELHAQPRLLRALERRQVKPVGGSSYRAVDVRVIAATNRDLAEEVRAGRFRDDLYHRLAVVEVRIPPLRERRDDIVALVTEFLAGSATVSPEAMTLLCEYRWPGNVRELKNVIERGRSMLPPLADGAPKDEPRVITAELLGLPPPGEEAQVISTGRFREEKERVIDTWEFGYVQRLIERAEGNVSRAARYGGLDRVYLHRLMKKHGIDHHAVRVRHHVAPQPDDKP